METIHQETIVATATPAGRGGVAIVRVSGPLVQTITKKIVGKLPTKRYAHFSSFKDADGTTIDQGLALYFSAPHSFTGEDVVEFHCHGGVVIVSQLTKHIVALGARLARPGEFSERAFLNHKMDLIQAEAIADLIDATSTKAARSALSSLQGDFSKKINDLVKDVISLRVYVEAAIDFAEEEVDFLGDSQIKKNLVKLMDDIEHIKNSAKQGSLLREGITAVIVGKPNAGKSSLLNQLSGKDIAIVTPIAGTTRDVLREYIMIDDIPMHVIDTAGLRESNDVIEQEGIRRTHHEITKADIILFIYDACEAIPELMIELPKQVPLIYVRNKIDLIEEKEKIEKNTISLSAKQGVGMDLLKNYIKSCVGYQQTNEGIFSARQRHLDALDRAYKYLLDGKQQLENFKAGELLAEDLRQVQHALNEITGEFTSDDLLGKIFSSFCIGK